MAFKPRILAALGHRRVEEAADLCAAAIASKNLDIAMAGMKAGGAHRQEAVGGPEAP